MREWVRDRSLGVLFVGLFLTSWVAQLFVEWQVFADEQREHDAKAVFWSADFWETFGQSTLENWQSEFLQLAALLQQQGIDPESIEQELPAKYWKTR